VAAFANQSESARERLADDRGAPAQASRSSPHAPWPRIRRIETRGRRRPLQAGRPPNHASGRTSTAQSARRPHPAAMGRRNDSSLSPPSRLGSPPTIARSSSRDPLAARMSRRKAARTGSGSANQSGNRREQLIPHARALPQPPFPHFLNSVCLSSNPRADTFRRFCHPPSEPSPAEPNNGRALRAWPGAPRSPSHPTNASWRCRR
jgi:hypothetical protein